MKITRKTSTTFHIAHGKQKIVIMCDRLVPTVTVDGMNAYLHEQSNPELPE